MLPLLMQQHESLLFCLPSNSNDFCKTKTAFLLFKFLNNQLALLMLVTQINKFHHVQLLTFLFVCFIFLLLFLLPSSVWHEESSCWSFAIVLMLLLGLVVVVAVGWCFLKSFAKMQNIRFHLLHKSFNKESFLFFKCQDLFFSSSSIFSFMLCVNTSSSTMDQLLVLSSPLAVVAEHAHKDCCCCCCCCQCSSGNSIFLLNFASCLPNESMKALDPHTVH